MALYIIDPLCEGHIDFNNLLLATLKEIHYEDIYFCGKKSYINKIKIENNRKIEIEDFYFGFSNKILYRFIQLRVLKRIKKALKKRISINDSFLFSSFETISFSLFSRFLFNNVSIINHNNIDETEKSIVKRFFFKIINRKIKHIVFMHKSRQLLESWDIKSYVINHPIVFNHNMGNRNTGTAINIAALSGTITTDQINDLLKIIPIESYTLYCKMLSGLDYTNKRIHTEKYYSNYDEIIKAASFIYSPVLFNNRISGVVFSAFNYRKKVLMTKTGLGLELKKDFPNFVFFLEDLNPTLFQELIKPISNNDILYYKDKYSLFNCGKQLLTICLS